MLFLLVLPCCDIKSVYDNVVHDAKVVNFIETQTLLRKIGFGLLVVAGIDELSNLLLLFNDLF